VRFSGLYVALALLAGLAAHGCGWLDTADDCALDPILHCGPFAAGTGSSTSTGTSSSTGTGGSMPDCTGDPTKDPAIVRDDCGVFVSASAAPGGDGKKATPFQTFADAASAGMQRVFACAEAYTETKGVSFTGGVEVYGGFTDCAKGWAWAAGSKATVTTAPDVPGLVLDGGANKLQNVDVTAPGATMPGESSIAVLASGGSLDVTNGNLTAGDAKDGDNGATVPDDSTLDGDSGDPGVGICGSGANNPGPTGKTKTCADGSSSVAGNGGDGGLVMSMMLQPAGSGTDGSAIPPVGQPTDGQGGLGEGQLDASMMPVASCKTGQPGANGLAGNPGDGATGIGALSKAGYAGTAGKDGTNGAPGQGAGGGGGAKGGLMINCGMGAIDRVGASGGAGGTGGCGGALGGGGKAGGSSIALMVLDAQVTLSAVTLTAGKGGNGGTGGDGQSGGQKGTGGTFGAGKGTAQPSCQGGAGGAGGPGGAAGGGQGGHSLAIAFQGSKSPVGGTFQIDMTKAGKGGLGGANNAATNMGKGADGMAANCWDFAANAACK
jgi:hypothetical protein